MTDKKPKLASTLKGVLSKLSRSPAAAKFLTEYREFLLAQASTKPLIEKLEAKEALPTPTLAKVYEALRDDYIAGKEPEKDGKPGKPPKEQKDFYARIADADGKLQWRMTESGNLVAMEDYFDSYHEAEKYCDRMLVNHASADTHGEVFWAKCPEKVPALRERIVDRNDSIARAFPKKPGPVMEKEKKMTGKMKCETTRCHFSHG